MRIKLCVFIFGLLLLELLSPGVAKIAKSKQKARVQKLQAWYENLMKYPEESSYLWYKNARKCIQSCQQNTVLLQFSGQFAAKFDSRRMSHFEKF